MSNTQTIIDLTAARELIAKPGGWTHTAFARALSGVWVNPIDVAAVSWCSVGSVFCATGKENLADWGPREGCAIDALSRSLPPTAVALAHWNDAPGRTQAEVVALFTATIDRLVLEDAGEVAALAMDAAPELEAVRR